ncbi:MAG: hypothetical protein II978_02530 [Clostridia bacterium]|nr:hypothetical protein [Clostridia bacterium]
MTGCGKTTVGRALSYRLKMPFIDMDALIEKKAGIIPFLIVGELSVSSTTRLWWMSR